jgi:Lon protease-like protein
MKKLPQNIPLFPLPGALLLPNSRLPLNIFESRYINMVEDTIATKHRLIGMIQPVKINNGKELSENNKYQKVGCAGRIVSFTETGDGRYLITLEGVSRFCLKNEVEHQKPYILSQIDWNFYKNDLIPFEDMNGFDRNGFLEILKKYLDSAQIASDWEVLRKAKEEVLINSLSMLCPFEPEEKQVLLEADTIRSRLDVLVTLMKLSSENDLESQYVQ